MNGNRMLYQVFAAVGAAAVIAVAGGATGAWVSLKVIENEVMNLKHQVRSLADGIGTTSSRMDDHILNDHLRREFP